MNTKMIKTFFLSCILLSGFFLTAIAQPSYFKKFKNLDFYDYTLNKDLTALSKVIEDPTDNLNVVLGCKDFGNQSLSRNLFIAKLNNDGTILWQQEIVPPNIGDSFYVAMDFIVSRDQSNIVDGYVATIWLRTPSSFVNGLIIKFTTTGNVMWSKRISQNNIMNITQLANGNYAFTSIKNMSQHHNLFITELAFNGSAIVNNRVYYNEGAALYPHDIIQDQNGDILVSSCKNFTGGIYSMNLIKVNSTTYNRIFDRNYQIAGTQNTWGDQIIALPNGNYFVSGLYKNTSSRYAPITMMLDNLGNPINANEYNFQTPGQNLHVMGAGYYVNFMHLKPKNNSTGFVYGFHSNNTPASPNPSKRFVILDLDAAGNLNTNSRVYYGLSYANSFEIASDFVVNADNSATFVRGTGHILKTNTMLKPPTGCMTDSLVMASSVTLVAQASNTIYPTASLTFTSPNYTSIASNVYDSTICEECSPLNISSSEVNWTRCDASGQIVPVTPPAMPYNQWATPSNSLWVGPNSIIPGEDCKDYCYEYCFDLCEQGDVTINLSILSDDKVKAIYLNGNLLPSTGYGFYQIGTEALVTNYTENLKQGNHCIRVEVTNHQFYNEDPNVTGVNITGTVQLPEACCDNGTGKKTSNATPAINPIQNTEETLQVFPNPTHDMLTIVLPNTLATEQMTIEILSSTGATLKKITTSDKNQIVDVKALQNGVYIIRAKSANGQQYQSKFTKY